MCLVSRDILVDRDARESHQRSVCALFQAVSTLLSLLGQLALDSILNAHLQHGKTAKE